MSNIKKLNLQFALPVSILKEDRYFIAYTPALDLSTSATSFELVKKRFEEVVNIFFEELLDKGTVDQVLTDLGWKKIEKEWKPPVVISQESESFRIPLSI